MALPSYSFALSSSGVDFLPPDSVDTHTQMISQEKGGVAISDPSEGLDAYTWKSRYTPSTGTITLINTDTEAEWDILTGVMQVDSLSFAFDQNMRPFITYSTELGSAYYYWFSTLVNAYVTTALPANTVTPKACHDDKRDFAVEGNKSDILLFYITNDILYVRVQRERYETPHQVATLVAGTRLKRVGMTVQLRIKLELIAGGFISSP